jgi:hypothetical protein
MIVGLAVVVPGAGGLTAPQVVADQFGVVGPLCWVGAE